jgi:hypothetical protein
MSGAADLCPKNPLDESIPFMAPEPYVITRAVIDQLTAIVDRDIQTESDALKLYFVDFKKVEKGLSKLSEKESPMDSKSVKSAFNSINRFSTFYRTLRNSEIKTYAKQNFIQIPNRFLNKATSFNTKPMYIDPLYLKNNNRQVLDLEPIEIAALKSYTKHGDGILNYFLRKKGETYVSMKPPPIIDETLKCFKPHITIDSEYREEKIYFTFFKILYNVIAKLKMAYHPTDKYIRVFRGVSDHYLSEEPNRAFYIQSFLSTSYSVGVAESYGHTEYGKRGEYGGYIINVFYVHPSCYYSNVKSVSRYQNEKEILITPYCRYVFLKKNTFWTRESIRGGMPRMKYPALYTKYYYAIFPTDVAIPASFDGFLEFVKSPPSEAAPIADTESRERVVVNIAEEEGAAGAGAAAGGTAGGGHTRRRRSKRRTTRKYRTK